MHGEKKRNLILKILTKKKNNNKNFLDKAFYTMSCDDDI